MQLVEQGSISLDEPLDKLLPEMAEIPPLNEDKKLIKAKNSITPKALTYAYSWFWLLVYQRPKHRLGTNSKGIKY